MLLLQFEHNFFLYFRQNAGNTLPMSLITIQYCQCVLATASYVQCRLLCLHLYSKIIQYSQPLCSTVYSIEYVENNSREFKFNAT